MLETLFSLVFLAQVLRISVPYVLAALGGVVSERAGVIALGLEGELLFGAFASVVVTHATGSPWLGLLAGVVAGTLFAGLLALVALRLHGDQIVAGIALNLLAVGTTRYLLKWLYDSTSNSPRIEAFAAPAWAKGPLLELLTHPVFLLALVLALVAQPLLFSSTLGLRLRAVGEHPEAADTLGVSVGRTRLAGVLASGALAGLGGVWLAFDQHQFVDQMSSLRGYIALAAVIFGRWRPWAVTLACLGFGAAEALQIALQSARSGVKIPTQIVQMIPYVLTMVTLVTLGVTRGRARGWLAGGPPAALGRPYLKE